MSIIRPREEISGLLHPILRINEINDVDARCASHLSQLLANELLKSLNERLGFQVVNRSDQLLFSLN